MAYTEYDPNADLFEVWCITEGGFDDEEDAADAAEWHEWHEDAHARLAAFYA